VAADDRGTAVDHLNRHNLSRGARLGLTVFWAVFLGLSVFGCIMASIATSRQPTSAVPSAGASQGTTSPPPAEPSFVEAGKPQLLFGTWLVTAGAGPLEFRHHLGSEWSGKDADKGYVYVLVPLSITNDSKQTDSYPWVTWLLKDDEDYTYKIESGADFYLPQSRVLDTSNFPPGATRTGVLVFQVREGVKDLYLSCNLVNRQGLPWHFKVSQGG